MPRHLEALVFTVYSPCACNTGTVVALFSPTRFCMVLARYTQCSRVCFRHVFARGGLPLCHTHSLSLLRRGWGAAKVSLTPLKSDSPAFACALGAPERVLSA